MSSSARLTRRRLPRAALLLSAAMLATLASAGCGASVGGAPPCLPPEHTVSPSSVKPGDSVTVSAAEAKCDPRYGDDARISIVLIDAAGVEVLNTTAPMADAGGFTFTAEVPLNSAPGVMAVNAMPQGVDWCDDTGKNNRVSQGEFPLERASCVLPTKPLNITK
ncbi:hypothetical protein [Paenarthrobacter sp.]|uniref:hypothetical protein n=1 Tax=Paenarthrobacter sp. TaxID=1931993 RepID=UPI0028111D74|nr:hypothetical protein [Paenarthrobacter sp.]